MPVQLPRREFLKKSIKAAAGIGGWNLILSGCRKGAAYDLVILGGRILDGTGKQDYIADIGILGDSIAKIGKISASQGKRTLDARNLIVCPGFIDAHDHSDIGLLVNPKAESHIRQGITTVVSGNCGESPFPIADEIFEETRENFKNNYDIDLNWKNIDGFFQRLQSAGTALNYSTFVGQGTIRGAAMGFHDRPPRPEEVTAMKVIVSENIRAGAIGLSSGLEYAPGSFALREELTELCRAAAESGGIYSTHMRDEGDALIESIEENLDIARRTGIRIQISHLKAAYSRNWHKLDQALQLLESAGREGLKIYCDRYPYIAGASGLSSFNFPLWALQGGTDEFISRLKDPTVEIRLREYVNQREKKLGSWENVVISSVMTDKNRIFEGKSIHQAALETGKDAFEFMRDLLIEENNQVGQIIFMMTEENLRKILAHPMVGVGCDGSALAPYGILGKGKPHPRNYGTFPRVLGKYTRDEKILPLPEMVKKLTSVPAENFGFRKRGVVQLEYKADLVVFDEKQVRDRATWSEPHQYPEGIPHVVVNGVPVIEQGEHTGSLPGRILKRSST